jgi:hypothetical protein
MFEIEEKAKRKSKNTDQDAPRVCFKYMLWGLLPLIAVILAVVYISLKPRPPVFIDVITSESAATNAYIALAIEQTNAAATQFYLATTSPNAPTPSP